MGLPHGWTDAPPSAQQLHQWRAAHQQDPIHLRKFLCGIGHLAQTDEDAVVCTLGFLQGKRVTR
jgi:hypothetical protein